jgi:tetraacyldisaccharide 4'-kinase
VDRADALLLTRLEAASEEELAALEARLGKERTFRVARRATGWRTVDGTPAPAPARAFLLAAIARPERFEGDVAAGGTAVVGRAFFRDHHRFRAGELGGVAAQARAAGADAIATTAKDAVRLPGSALGMPVCVLGIAAAIAGEERLRERLLAVARRAA